MKRTNWSGWLFIGLGVALLLNHFNLLESNKVTSALILSAFLIFVFVKRARQHPRHKGIIGAVFFTAFFLIILFMNMGWLPIDDRLGSGLIILALGFANLVYYVITKLKISNLVFAIIFSVIGIPFVVSYFKWMEAWELESIYSVYWPVILILIGLAVLADGLFRHMAAKRNRDASATDITEP